MAAYYNEFEPYAAQWLRNLIAAGHIADGVVDERSIVDVRADDLREFTQCHFFAGIGGWSYALRLAGWDDARPVWTGSCPCQPFSAAGKGKGGDDHRHLWPEWFRLIRECRPGVIFGEQVEAAIRHGWLDAVCSDLESQDYACGAVAIPAASVGAPHIRSRLWFVAHHHHAGCGLERCGELLDGQRTAQRDDADRRGADGELAHAAGERKRSDESGRDRGDGQQLGRPGARRDSCDDGADGNLADAMPAGRPERRAGAGLGSPAGSGSIGIVGNNNNKGLEGRAGAAERACELPAGQTGMGSFWSDAEWIWCRDGKFRPVEPGIFPLVDGSARGMVRGSDHRETINANATSEARVQRLRGYGNAIVAPLAAEFIRAYMECRQ